MVRWGAHTPHSPDVSLEYRPWDLIRCVRGGFLNANRIALLFRLWRALGWSIVCQRFGALIIAGLLSSKEEASGRGTVKGRVREMMKSVSRRLTTDILIIFCSNSYVLNAPRIHTRLQAKPSQTKSNVWCRLNGHGTMSTSIFHSQIEFVRALTRWQFSCVRTA